MPKKYRLSVADLKVFRPERRLAGEYFSLGIAGADRLGAACVVSKKVAARAVDRNTVKRRVRSILITELPHLSPATYVFYAKKGVVEATFADIRKDISKMLARTS